MKLVIATPLYPPEIGGPATYVSLLEQGFPEKGITVEVVKFSAVRHLPKIIRHYAFYRRVRRAARSADAVLALDPVSVGLPALCAARGTKKPFVVKIVGDYAWEQGQQRFGVTETLDEFIRQKPSSLSVRLLQFIQTYVAQHARRVIVPSAYLKGVVTAWGVPERSIQVIYNAVSIEKIGTVPEAVGLLPRPVVVSIGRLVPWKGMDRLIDGVWSARREGSAAALVIVGDGPERKNLETHASRMLKNGYVFTGQLSHPDTLAVMQAADIFVLNSSYEGLSHVLIEAVTLGACIIATDAGGNGEIIVKGNGLIIKTGDTNMLGSDLKILIEHQDKRKLLSITARESAKRFSLDTMLSETCALLKHI